MLIYGLKNCDKCRAARKVLQSAEFFDIREVPFTVTAIIKLIDTILTQAGGMTSNNFGQK